MRVILQALYLSKQMNLESLLTISTFCTNVFWIRGVFEFRFQKLGFLALERLLVQKSERNKNKLWNMNITLPEDIKSNIDFITTNKSKDFTSLNTSFSNLVDFIDSIPLGLKIAQWVKYQHLSVILDSFITNILAETQQKDPWKISFGLSSATVWLSWQWFLLQHMLGEFW